MQSITFLLICGMSKEENPYQLFTQDVLSIWKSQDVSYIKVEELSQSGKITFFELIPDSELLDGGDLETLYPIDSEDVNDMLLPSKSIKFVVHSIYLED